MEVFPQEVIERVARYSDIDTRRNLLTVSRGFQVAVERASWSGYINLQDSDVGKLLALYHGHRVRLLRNITFSVHFPELRETEEDLLKCRETTEELQANDQLFTRQISDLLIALKTLEERETDPNNRTAGIDLTIQTPHQRDNNIQHCDHRRYHSWRLHLLNSQTLPELSSIRTLTIGEKSRYWSDFSCRYERPLDLRVVVDLVSKLPNLEALDCLYLHDRFPFPYEDAVIRHFTRPWEGPRRDSRRDFGKAMETHAAALPAKLKSAKLHFGNVDELGDDMDQSKPIPDLVKPLSYDSLSSALRVFSQHLTELDLRICADSSLFWPSSQEAHATPPSWPCLKRLRVEFHPASPSGVWYFQGPRGEGRQAVGYEVTEQHYPPVEENEADDEWDDVWSFEGGRYENVAPDVFRTVPIDETIEPLLEAFAKALDSSRSLEEAELFTYLSWCPSEEREREYPDPPLDEGKHRWGVRYLASGTSRRLEWQVGDWRPSNALLQLFHGVGRDQYWRDLEEQWVEL
ncbi:MAG: hypothetical protein M1816_003908 [Peltula sp. TS41687]|nr:MAG: hypothetical protein M1816_003908 [Peltula sp. TS41687]